MAVIANPNDPNAQKITQQQTGPTGAPLQTIGTAAPASQTPTGGAQAKPQQGSGRFTNLQKYLGANKTAGAQVAGSVGQGLQKQFGEQSNKAQGYYNQLGTSIDQAKGEAAKVTNPEGGFQQKLSNIGTSLQAQKIGPAVDANDAGFAAQYKAPEQTGPYSMTQTELDDHRNKALAAYNAQRSIDEMNAKRNPGLNANRKGDGRGLSDFFGGYADQITDPARQAEYKEKLASINNRQHPMDFGPNSANAASMKRQSDDRAALMAEYGIVKPQAVESPNLSDMEKFVQDPSFADYKRFQSGAAIDENLMSLQQQKANQSALAAAQGAQQAQQALGTESGRFNLLRQQFGSGPRSGYSQGQQRLDQVFLGQGGGLQDLQAKTSDQARKDLALAKQAAGRQGEVNTLASQEQGLIGGLNTQAQANEKAYVDALASYGGATQELRNRDFDKLGNALSSYTEQYNPATATSKESYSAKKYTPGLDADQMKRMGLNDSNQGVYNVFKDDAFRAAQKDKDNSNTALANVVAQKGQEVRLGGDTKAYQTAQDVANEKDVARYAALSKMMANPSANGITQAANLGDTWTNRTDNGSDLRSRLQKAQEGFDVVGKNIQYVNPYTHDVISASHSDLLNKGIDAAKIKDYSDGRTVDLNSLSAGENKTQWGSNMRSAYQKLLDQQNYNQTLGGRRETFLDTEAAAALAKKGITPKMNPTPVTEVDPNIAYRNALLSKINSGG